MEELYMPTLSHFENGNGWTGSRGVMNYEIEEPQEDGVRLVAWYGPFSRDYAQVVAEALFPMTQEGRSAWMDWIVETAKEMNEHPQMTPQECRAYYLKLKSEY